jgi:hypothetical protein
MPRECRAQIKALLLALPATPSGKELVPKYVGLLATIISSMGDGEDPRNWRYDDAREELLRISKLIEGLSPAARAGLTSGPMQDPHRLAQLFRLAAEEVDQLLIERVQLDRGGQPRGRGPAVWPGAIADAAASAYALIMEANPPVLDFYGAGHHHPYHELVRALFTLARLRASSENQARLAAGRFARKMRKTPAK